MSDAPHETLLAMLNGSEWVSALRDDGRPAPIRWPDDEAERAELIDKHLAGSPMELTFHARGCEPWSERVRAVALAGFSPDAGGLVRSIAVDLDAADGHGPNGLADPAHAMRCLASAADVAGFLDGLLCARSRGGRGRHVLLILPSPVSLDDAVLGVASLVARAYKLAAADAADYNAPHAFRRPNGSIAAPGSAGAIELFPKSTICPPIGWALALPAAGAFRENGGGVIVDGFGDQPFELDTVPRCDTRQWQRFLDESRAALPKSSLQPKPRQARAHADGHDPLDRIDQRTRQFLDGHVPQGGRNAAAYAASCNLLAVGVVEREAERLILEGAASCGLPEIEARTVFGSAIATMRRRGAIA